MRLHCHCSINCLPSRQVLVARQMVVCQKKAKVIQVFLPADMCCLTLRANSIGNSMLFKFSVTPAGSALAKNGVHWADSTTYPYNIADATLAAEAARLVNTHLSSGSVPLLDNVALPASSDRLFLAVSDEGQVWEAGRGDERSCMRQSGLAAAVAATDLFTGLVSAKQGLPTCHHDLDT